MKLCNRFLTGTVISLFTLGCVFAQPSQLSAAPANLALGKTMTASTVYKDRNGVEQTATRGAHLAADGDRSGANSRWAAMRTSVDGNRPSNATDTAVIEWSTYDQWLTVDLGEAEEIGKIDVYWEGAFAAEYELQGSPDGQNWFSIAKKSEPKGAAAAKTHSFDGLSGITARFVRVQCLIPNIDRNAYSIYELEVYGIQSVTDAQTLAATVKTPPVLNNGEMVLPSVEGFTTTLFGSDNKQVLAMDGTFRQPLVDMDVNVLYRFTNNSDPADTAVSKADINFIAEGLYDQETGDNPVPDVLPAIREWKGQTGEFALIADSAIAHDGSPEAEAAAGKVQFFFEEMLGKNLAVTQTEGKNGDVALILDASKLSELGAEGYYLTVGDRITITAPTETGLMYGGVTVTQILSQSPEKDTTPQGLARDYPKFPVRAGMVDVGRMYIPIGYLEEMGLYMAYYKMNELHVHLNDYWGASKYSAFRLQSERYPGIVATDGFYTKDEYRAFQKAVRAYGVDVVSEIDTPYHAESFRGIPGITMISAGQMEIRTEPERTNVVNLITDLFDEYLEGPDPVFVGKKVHVGTDEYLDNTAQAREAMRDYTDRLIKYVNNYESEAHPDGLEARVWASLGGGGAQRGFTGTTPVSSDAVLNLWAPYWAGAEYTYELGSDIINTYGGFLYIVPGANAGYPDRWNGLYQNNGYHNYNFDFLYNTFNVNNYNATRNANLGGTGVLPIAHPRSVGAQFCVWNDMTSFYGGISEFDVFDRMRDAVALVSEKTWYGEQTEGQTAESFIARAKKLGNQAPGANPARFVASETDFVAGYNFRASDALSDLSGNGYDASGTGTTATGEGLRLNGGGAISLPFDSMGYPYTAHIRFKLDDVPENTVLFEGADGTLFANYNGTGHIGFERGTFGIAYAFEFMTGNTPVVSANEWVSLTFACGQKDIALYINGEKAAAYATSLRPVVNSRQRDSDTFVLPVESVFENADGVIAGLRVYNRILSDAEILSLYEDETQFGFIVTPGRINVSGTDVSAETVIANYTDTAEICNVILAVYTNGRLTDVNVQTITAAPGERLTVSNSAGGFGADSTAKLMVWDGGFIPLCPAVER